MEQITLKVNRVEDEWEAHGLVLGETWYGRMGWYPSEKVIASTREELDRKIEEGIKEGWLDRGMGFQALHGAVMEITHTRVYYLEGDFTPLFQVERDTALYGEEVEKREEEAIEALIAC